VKRYYTGVSKKQHKQKRKHRNYYKQIQNQKPKQIPKLKQKFSLRELLSSTTQKNEKITATLIALFVLILVHAPMILFALFPKDGLVFLGRHNADDGDVYTYISYIEQAKQGKWLLRNNFTSEYQVPSLIRPSYILIGKFAAITHISSLLAYHVAQIIFCLFFFVVAYQFIRKLFKTPKQRLLVFFILLTSSGFGWLFGQFIDTTDLYVVEANTFLALGNSPHFILSHALMLSGVLLYLKFIERKKFVFGILTALVLFPLAFEHPFDLMILAPVFFLTGLWTSLPFIQNITVSALVAIPLVFPILQVKQNAIFAAEQAQRPSYSPNPFNWILGFGFLLPLAIYGITKYRPKARPLEKLLIVWVVIAPFLVYCPVEFQRRLSEGLHIPIAMLAVLGLMELYNVMTRKAAAILPKVKQKEIKRLTKAFIVGIAVLLAFTSVSHVVDDIKIINKNSLYHYYFYISYPEYDAISWIKINVPENTVILANFFYGNIIAGMTARQVYVGHSAQTIHFDQKVEKINNFIINTDNTSAYQFLEENSIQYIFTTKSDSLTAYGFKPDEKPYLEKVYDHDGVYIYKVKEDY